MNTFGRRFGISLFLLIILTLCFVWFFRPNAEQVIPILVWGAGVSIGIFISRASGTSCILKSGIGGAAGVSLFLFYMVPIPPPIHQVFPLMLMVSIGTVAGSILGTAARWCKEGISLRRADVTTPTLASPVVRRRWYQFTLQRLLLMFVLTAAVFASVGLRSIHLRVQSVAMTELRAVGGAFGFQGNWVTHCYLSNPKVRNQHLDSLQSFPRLDYLSLEGSRVTDTGLAKIESLRSLRGLRLKGTAITDAGVESLEKMQSLRELNLENTNVTNSGIQRLRESLPHCKIVN